MTKHPQSFMLAGSYFARLLYGALSKKLTKAGEIFIFPDEKESLCQFTHRYAAEILQKLEDTTAEYLVLDTAGAENQLA